MVKARAVMAPIKGSIPAVPAKLQGKYMPERPSFKDFKDDVLNNAEVKKEYEALRYESTSKEFIDSMSKSELKVFFKEHSSAIMFEYKKLEKENEKLKEYQKALMQSYAQLLADKMGKNIEND